jgi:hypothetical protein
MDLAQTIAHESLHQTQESALRRMGRENPGIDDEASKFISENRGKIDACLKEEGCAI